MFQCISVRNSDNCIKHHCMAVRQSKVFAHTNLPHIQWTVAAVRSRTSRREIKRFAFCSLHSLPFNSYFVLCVLCPVYSLW